MRRPHDTDLWDEPWYQEMPPEYGRLWHYSWDKANLAGIWNINMRLASFIVGGTVTLEDLPAEFRRRIHFLPGDQTKCIHLTMLPFLNPAGIGPAERPRKKLRLSGAHIRALKDLVDAGITLSQIVQWRADAGLDNWDPYTPVLREMAQSEYITIGGYNVSADVGGPCPGKNTSRPATSSAKSNGKPLPPALPAPSADDLQAFERIRARMQAALDREHFNTWCTADVLRVAAPVNGELHLAVPSAFNQSWLERNFVDEIALAAEMPANNVTIYTDPDMQGDDDE